MLIIPGSSTFKGEAVEKLREPLPGVVDGPLEFATSSDQAGTTGPLHFTSGSGASGAQATVHNG